MKCEYHEPTIPGTTNNRELKDTMKRAKTTHLLLTRDTIAFYFPGPRQPREIFIVPWPTNAPASITSCILFPWRWECDGQFMHLVLHRWGGQHKTWRWVRVRRTTRQRGGRTRLRGRTTRNLLRNLHGVRDGMSF
jgi:hypothetical protein